MGIETKFIRQNGEYIPWEDSMQHTVSHALHYGTSVFEGIRFYDTENGPKIFRLYDHIVRLFHSAKVTDMEVNFTIQEIVDACKNLIQKNNLKSGYIRPIFYYGYGKMGLDPKGAKLECVISSWNWGKYLSDEAIKVFVSSYIRPHPKSIEITAKVGGYYVNSMLSHRESSKKGYDEALLLDYEGYIAEGPGENIFFIKDNVLYTPALGSILPGFTRDTIMTICEENLGIITLQEKILPEDLADFDEAFFVGTAAEVTPICEINDADGNIYEFDNSVTNNIKELYSQLVTGKLGHNERLF
ncbi:MAG: branched-chain amino acid transaminase [Candidatus Absconditabacteria bacterium]